MAQQPRIHRVGEHSAFSGNTLSFTRSAKYVRKIYAYRKNFEVERASLRLLARLGLPSPRVYRAFPSGRYPAILLSPLLGDALDLQSLDSRLRRAIGRKLGVLVSRMHSVTKGFAPHTKDIPARDKTACLAHVDNIANKSLRRRIAKIVNDNSHLLDLSNLDVVLLHRDIRPANVLVNWETEDLFLLDFEVAAWGHPFGDIARPLFFEFLEFPDFVSAFEEGYGLTYSCKRSRAMTFFRLLFALEMNSHFKSTDGRVVHPLRTAIDEELHNNELL